jgi:hypothetical protein
MNWSQCLCRCIWNSSGQRCAAWCLTELIVQFDACICKWCAYDERCALWSCEAMTQTQAQLEEQASNRVSMSGRTWMQQ